LEVFEISDDTEMRLQGRETAASRRASVKECWRGYFDDVEGLVAEAEGWTIEPVD
jgi:hypothetical protein